MGLLGEEESVSVIGTQLGQFVIERLLGRGGMGAVYLASHVVLRTPRAVKILLPELTQNPEIVRRFINEARAAASMMHRNIIAVHDCGQLPSGEWFIVLDYVEGATLTQRITQWRGPMAPQDILHIFVEIANGLQVAHEHNIIHRDLKPDNIYLSNRDGDPHRVVLLDFGVAKLGEEIAGHGAATRTGALIGTPAYMSPEQLRGANVTSSSDIYALGVILYQMCSGGQLPYQTEGSPGAYYELTPAEMYHRQISGPPNDLRRYVPGLSEVWNSTILAALHPEPSHRPLSARNFALRLAEAASGDAFTPNGMAIVRRYAHELLSTEPGAASASVELPVEGASRNSGPQSVPRYQLGRKLGSGGMAEVFAGTVVGAEGFARQVAIKRVLAGFSEVPAFATMFVEEARIASRLNHPNVVSVLDFDRDPEGRLFLVMEYVEGVDLAALMAAGPLPLSVAIFVIKEVLSGLGYAHQPPSQSGLRGVIHRDVSPHNVLLSWEGAVKVSDFGIAKALDASSATSTGTLKGKPAYMSPEQANGEPLDPRSDLFSVGILLWELLTGKSLFNGTAKELVAQVLFKEIPRPSSLHPKIPADVDAVVMKLLQRHRPDRYRVAEEVIEDLSRCAAHPRNGRGELMKLLPTRFTAKGERHAVGAAAPTTLSRAAYQPSARKRRHSRWLYATGAALVAALCAVVVLATRGSGSSPAAAVAKPGQATESSAPAEVAQAPLDLVKPTPIAPPSGTPAAVASAAAPGTGGAAPTGTADAPPPAPPPVAAGIASPAAKGASAPAGNGEIIVRVDPWAKVWIDGVAYGQTPVTAKVRAGRHRVRIEKLAQQKTVNVMVRTAKQSIIEETW
jgi:serine/threonine protein kinase